MTQATELRRTLSLTQVTLYGLGTTIGAGIYALIGAVAGAAGTHAPVAFVLASLFVAFTALSFAEMSARYPAGRRRGGVRAPGLRIAPIRACHRTAGGHRGPGVLRDRGQRLRRLRCTNSSPSTPPWRSPFWSYRWQRSPLGASPSRSGSRARSASWRSAACCWWSGSQGTAWGRCPSVGVNWCRRLNSASGPRCSPVPSSRSMPSSGSRTWSMSPKR